jgi:hypothetical protein
VNSFLFNRPRTNQASNPFHSSPDPAVVSISGNAALDKLSGKIGGRPRPSDHELE